MFLIITSLSWALQPYLFQAALPGSSRLWVPAVPFLIAPYHSASLLLFAQHSLCGPCSCCFVSPTPNSTPISCAQPWAGSGNVVSRRKDSLKPPTDLSKVISPLPPHPISRERAVMVSLSWVSLLHVHLIFLTARLQSQFC